MKKTLTGVVALLAGAFVAHSQGTVSFANYGSGSGTYVYVTLKSTGANLGGTGTVTTGTPASDVGNGSDWSVALYGAAGSGATSVSQLDTAGGTPVVGTLETGGLDSTAGTWLSTLVAVVPGTTGNGSAATVQVYAWYNDGGTLSYSQALAAGDPTGTSALANVTTGGPNATGPASTAAYLPAAGLGNFSVGAVPEPSTVALGVMGASAFLLRLRRKK
jgi:hypothetical protein